MKVDWAEYWLRRNRDSRYLRLPGGEKSPPQKKIGDVSMSPLSKHFKGKGAKVMRSMRKQYGDKAEEIFYATENKMNPFFGNSLPFQLGDGDRWVKDSRKMGAMSMKKGK
jgi:hypothetical protein